jgi:L-ascorbate metabolism protein UlaG (beta-lactamase superfamily)
MREQHVDPDEAVQIMEILGAVRAVGIHWGTFQLTNEAWGEPPTLLVSPTDAVWREWHRGWRGLLWLESVPAGRLDS